MSDPQLFPFIYAQEISLHIRVSRKFHFLLQLRELVGTKNLSAALASPLPIIYPVLRVSLVWEVYIFVLL